MKHKADLFYQKNDQNIESEFIPLIYFKCTKQKEISEKYIWKQVKLFFTKLNIDIDETSPISSNQIITEKDFENFKDNDYFYKNIFNQLERSESDGKLKMDIKWGITFDKKCAPIDLKFTNKPLGFGQISDKEFSPVRSYGTIDIAGNPIFYYIYFTLQEILDEIKSA